VGNQYLHWQLIFFLYFPVVPLQMDEGIFPDLGDYIPSAASKSGHEIPKKKVTGTSYFGSSNEEEKSLKEQEAKAEKKKLAMPIPSAKPESSSKAAGILSR
jgi:hypothetical protein